MGGLQKIDGGGSEGRCVRAVKMRIMINPKGVRTILWI